MTTIHKYALYSKECCVDMPRDAKIISCQEQGCDIQLWAIVNTREPGTESRKFKVFATGEDMEDVQSYQFIGTVQSYSGLVHHVFERTAP